PIVIPPHGRPPGQSVARRRMPTPGTTRVAARSRALGSRRLERHGAPVDGRGVRSPVPALLPAPHAGGPPTVPHAAVPPGPRARGGVGRAHRRRRGLARRLVP